MVKVPRDHRQEAHLVALRSAGEYTSAELADLFGVARPTVYRAVERQRLRAAVGVGNTDG
jgi:excisionase family DNA binding protein